MAHPAGRLEDLPADRELELLARSQLPDDRELRPVRADVSVVDVLEDFVRGSATEVRACQGSDRDPGARMPAVEQHSHLAVLRHADDVGRREIEGA